MRQFDLVYNGRTVSLVKYEGEWVVALSSAAQAVGQNGDDLAAALGDPGEIKFKRGRSTVTGCHYGPVADAMVALGTAGDDLFLAIERRIAAAEANPDDCVKYADGRIYEARLHRPPRAEIAPGGTVRVPAPVTVREALDQAEPEPARSSHEPLAAPDAESPSTITINGWELVAIDGEDDPLVRDMELGRQAGLSQPRDIRRSIKRLVDAGAFPEGVRGYRARTSAGGGIGGVVEGYDLTEEQALVVLMELRTPNAIAIRRQLAKVFVAWRHDRLGHADVGPQLTGDPLTDALLVGADTRQRTLKLEGKVASVDAKLAEVEAIAKAARDRPQVAIIQKDRPPNGYITPSRFAERCNLITPIGSGHGDMAIHLLFALNLARSPYVLEQEGDDFTHRYINEEHLPELEAAIRDKLKGVRVIGTWLKRGSQVAFHCAFVRRYEADKPLIEQAEAFKKSFREQAVKLRDYNRDSISNRLLYCHTDRSRCSVIGDHLCVRLNEDLPWIEPVDPQMAFGDRKGRSRK